jgi:phosphoglucosamine mutase
MKRLFGTDGIRGIAGEPPLDRATVRRFGAALAEVLGESGAASPRVALGRDTRESGVWLRDAVAAGLTRRGGVAVDGGVLSTPGLAWAVRHGEFDAGVMISASHNPFEDNGLKVFAADGAKLSDERERSIERHLLDGDLDDPGEGSGAPPADPALARGYVAFLEGALEPGRLDGLRIALDCANGSASGIAPRVFRDYGADVTVIGDRPDGRNINLGCGSLHLDRLGEEVRRSGCAMGLAFDGDADRCLAVDGRGRAVDGDHILFIVGRRLKRLGRLRGDALVATIMSNYWLEERLGQEGIALHRAPVGDKYVLEQMQREKLALGGEQSGHIIFSELATTGDGMLTGLLLLDALLAERQTLEEILDDIVPYPQMLLNVHVREKPDLRRHPQIGPAVAEIESSLAGQGRVVLRYSGTEPVARVMLEGKDMAIVRGHAERLAELIAAELGGERA